MATLGPIPKRILTQEKEVSYVDNLTAFLPVITSTSITPKEKMSDRS
jgi:hypothetical protein